MTTQMFPTALRRFMTDYDTNGQIDLAVDDIRAVFFDSGGGHTLTFAEEFLSDITNPATALIGENGIALIDNATVAANTPSLAGKTTNLPANGVFDALDTVFSNVSGAQFEYILLFKWSGDRTTSPLICGLDNATGLPATPGGGNITVQWDSGGSRIFRFTVN